MMEELRLPIEDQLEAETAAEEAKRPPNPGKCEWCGGQCGVVKRDLYYHTIRYEDGSVFQEGWLSPDCTWLAQCARDAVENDNS